VLTAIAIELERDEAERRRHAQEQDRASGRGSYGLLGTERAFRASDVADRGAADSANGGAAGPGIVGPASGTISGTSPGSVAGSEGSETSLAASYGGSAANGSSANPTNGSGARLGNTTGDSHGVGASPVHGPPWGREALWPGAPVQQGDTSRGETGDQGSGAAEEAAVVQPPADTVERGEGTDARNAPGGPGNADPGPGVPLPRRAPGTNGAPEPPTELRREYLPPSVIGRRLDSEEHTQPLPKISGTGPGPGSGGPAATGPAPSVFTPIRRIKAPPADPTPAESPAAPGPPASGPSTAAALAASAELVPPGAPPAEEVPPETVPPDAKPSASTLTAAAAPTMAVDSAALAAASAPTESAGSAALAAASAPTMPVGSAALAAAAAAGRATPAETAETAADLAARPDLAAAPTAASASAPVTSPVASTPAPLTPAQPHPRTASLPAPSGYGRAARPGGTPPGKGRDAGPAAPPAALPAAKRPQRSGRPYRIAGVILAVVALLVAGVIALVLSGRTTHGHDTGSGSHVSGAGATVRGRAAAWVAFQVSRTAVVACDPVMCQTLKSDGLLASRLYPLGQQATSPLRSQIIVATAVVRARFGNLLGSVYAPAVLASFGAGPDRIDIRQTAQHGAAAYRAMVSAALATRKASGAQLLHNGRIAASPIARRELAAGEVDGRLLAAIVQMSAAHRIFIVEFGVPAPGANPDIPLRQADLAQDAHHHAGRAVSAGFVRSVVAFLHAQRGQFRPARVHLVRLPDGATVLRIQYTAPSPLGLPTSRA
jgi:hypothetical protein